MPAKSAGQKKRDHSLPPSQSQGAAKKAKADVRAEAARGGIKELFLVLARLVLSDRRALAGLRSTLDKTYARAEEGNGKGVAAAMRTAGKESDEESQRLRKHGENGAEMVVPLRGAPPVHVLEHALAWAEESLEAAMKQEGWQRKMKEAMQGAHGLTQEQVGAQVLQWQYTTNTQQVAGERRVRLLLAPEQEAALLKEWEEVEGFLKNAKAERRLGAERRAPLEKEASSQ